MSQKRTLEARGLYTDPNLLSKVPDGALVEADNIIIDRNGVIEPRRGFAKYGEIFGIGTDRAKQLLDYKNRTLIHYSNKLLYNNNPHNNSNSGEFLEFDGIYQELEAGLRIKFVESNRNLFFTTNDGIKKISAKTAQDFTTAAGFINDAGGVKALDVTGQLNTETTGFLVGNSKVAYRIVWGVRDNNDNLILGTPSSRLVITNFSNNSSNVNLEFVIPERITNQYFYQIYRTAVFTADGSLTLNDIDPGDEMQLVFEDFPTAAQLSAKSVEVTDITPEDFRAGGTFLYTNPNSGEGILQANEPPPKAKDLALYQGSTFYANTETRARLELSLLGVANFTSGVSSISIDDGVNPPQTYTFVGEKEITNIDFSSYTGTVPTDLDGNYFLINSASNKRKYYVWFDNTKTSQTLDFATYIGSIPSDLDGKYIVFYTPNDRNYYLWFDSTGTTVDPGSNPNNTQLDGLVNIRVDISSGVTTKADVAAAVDTALTTNNVFNDYDSVYTATDEFVVIETTSFDDTTVSAIETVEKGFVYTVNTPTTNDPANTPLVNTDISGRSAFKVDVSRGVSTTADVADAVAAAILNQDLANDFDVSYTTSNSFLDITNNNNGNTDDAVDSAIGTIGNGFAITVTQQGDGEDAASNEVLLSAAATPSLQIDESARSLVNIINKNPDSGVNAFYITGTNDLPGQLLLESRDIGVNEFSLIANNPTTGAQFNPAIPPAIGAAPVSGEPEINANRIYFSKIQQPEAVPIVNFLDVGPQDKEISRVLALRESLFILKQDGVYRLTGIGGNFAVDLFDESTKIIAPDSAVVLNNQIYCLTNQGVAVISDTGIDIISKQLDNIIQRITSSNFNFRFTSFGVSYETDRSYWLWVPTLPEDTVATQAFRYNTFTQSWTRHPIAKTCGIVNSSDDKLYLGPADENFIERERKNFKRTDYSDREFEISIPNESVNGNTISISQSNLAEIGDALVQRQYLTINDYNRILKKLDLDPSVGEKEITNIDFSSYTGIIPSDLNEKYFVIYSANDENKYTIVLDSVGNLKPLNELFFSDLRDSTQIIVNISSATTIAEVVNLIQSKLKTSVLDFQVSYTSGDEFFIITNTKNGSSTDAFDSTVNPIGSGFTITTTQQGFGSYFQELESFAGDNIKNKLDALATKLDLDPGISSSDFLSSISNYSATGSSVAVGNPATITELGHGLQTGRIITITNSTSTPNIDGIYSVTVIDPDTFTINIETTSSGICDWVADTATSQEHQGMYNTIVNKLNIDSDVQFTNYLISEDFLELESLVLSSKFNSPEVTLEYSLNFVEGPITLFKGIVTNLTYAPETFGDPSVMKQVREGTFMFENVNFSRGQVGYKTDLSPGLESIEFLRSGNGDWGFFRWGLQNWGGGFSGIPFRTYIPRSKQRCRYIQANFQHNSAREKWAIFGISYTVRGISERAYRD